MLRALGLFSTAPELRTEALRQIGALVEASPPATWREYTGQLMVVVMEGLGQEAQPQVRAPLR